MANQIERHINKHCPPQWVVHPGIFIAVSFLLLFDSSGIAQESRPLEFGKPIERELIGGEVHAYQINLSAGQYLHVVVDQRGIDVVMTLLGTDGKPIVEVDNPYSPQGVEDFSAMAEVSGFYRLEVRASEKQAMSGQYEAKITELRNATAQDQKRATAERLYTEAKHLYPQRTVASMRLAFEKGMQALALWREVGDRAKEAFTLQGFGDAFRELGELAQARGYYQQALPLWRTVGDHRMEGRALMLIGEIYNHLDEYRKTIDYCNQALSLFLIGRDSLAVPLALHLIGTAYNFLGEMQKGIEYYRQALPWLRATGHHSQEIYTIQNIGQAYKLLGENQKTLEYFEQALQLARTSRTHRWEAIVLNNIGTFYRDLGELQKALHYYDLALSVLRAAEASDHEAYVLSNIGAIYFGLGDKKKALDYFNQALALDRARGDRGGEAMRLKNFGGLYADDGEEQMALDYCQQALSLYRALENRSEQAATLLRIGRVYASHGDKQKSLDHTMQALQLYQLIADRNAEAAARYDLARVERAQGNLSDACTQIETAIALVDSVRRKVSGQEFRASYLASRQDYYDLYLDLLMQLHRAHPSTDYHAAALQASERRRGRSLLEILSEARVDIRQGVDSTLLVRERDLQELLNAKSQRLTKLLSDKPNEQLITSAKKELEALLTEYQEVQARVRSASPRYAALTQPQPLSTKEIQEQVIDNETTLLEYALGDDRSYLWALTPTTLNSFELPKRAEIDSLARRVYDLLTARNQHVANETPKQRRDRLAQADVEYQKSAAALSQILLAPVVEQLETKRLVVVTDGALQYIPFSALPVPVTSNQSSAISGEKKLKTDHWSLNTEYRPLGRDHEIVSLPSASVLAILRRELAGRQSAPKTVAVLADPVFSSDDSRVKRNQMIVEKKIGAPIASLENSRLFEGELERTARDFELRDTTSLRIPRLPFSRQEADGIVSKLPAIESMKALDFTANRATATSKELSQYRIVHFATHGLLNSMHPELSGIVLALVNENGEAQDGFLRLHEIYNLNLPADLVVLSACQTALGKEIKGEGLVGLTRGFMYAGAARVVASLWKVDDEATAELMKRFYHKMLGPEKLRPAAALRAAQVSMWKEKRWQSPYFWAAFVLQGEWK